MQVNGRGMSHDHAGICAGSCMASGSRCALGPYSTLDPQAVKAMEIEILTEGMCIVHQLNFAIVCFVYELVLQHGICTVTCVATPQKSVRKLRRVSDYSKGCQNYFMALQER